MTHYLSRRLSRLLALPLVAGSLGACMQTTDAAGLMQGIAQNAAQFQALAGGQVPSTQLSGAGNAAAGSAAGPVRSGPIAQPHPDAHHLTWDTKFTATGLADRKLVGHEFRFYCPPAPSRLVPRRLIGTDSYAFHSVVCRVAVHAGRINLNGGNITVKMNPGNIRLTGSTRNGFTTKDGPSGIRSLTFVN